MKLHFHLIQQRLNTGDTFAPMQGHNAIWMQRGSVSDGIDKWGDGDGFYAHHDMPFQVEQPSSFLCFNIQKQDNAIHPQNTLLSSQFEWAAGNCILRLDSVSFPKGAIAYRHIHAGAGARHLVRGGLEIKSDSDVTQMKIGDTWFEDANSPVIATATDRTPSQFIRAMILPQEFKGKTTITFLNPEDFEKPKLQTNQRFFDQQIAL